MVKRKSSQISFIADQKRKTRRSHADTAATETYYMMGVINIKNKAN